MNVYLHSKTELRIEFRYSQELVASVKELPRRTFDANTKSWIVPLADFEKVLERFPDCSLDYDVICATDNLVEQRAQLFLQNLKRLGIDIKRDQRGEIKMTGDGVSPILWEAVDERSDWLYEHMPQELPPVPVYTDGEQLAFIDLEKHTWRP